jgi:4-amino-4-deoxy-L-arabinose transferase-like glycosyltransferase
MSFEHRPSPARVTEAAAAKLPRWMFFGLLAAYIIPGLFARDPWSLEDASAFGVMWTMAHGSATEWWLPSVIGEPLPEEGPLPFWIGALMIRLFGGIFGDIVAARLVTVLWFLIATTSLWVATYRLARRPEAQPVAFAFGGEANPRDYGRMLADIAVLLMLATIGIVLRLHETVAETALFAFVAMLLLALSVSLEDPWKGTIGAAVALAAVALTRGLLPAGALMIAALIFVLSFGRYRALRAVVFVAIAVALFASWPLAAQRVTPQAVLYLDAWWAWNARELHGPSLSNVMWFVRNVGWYTWPLWPFALWTLYSWRSFWRRPHVLLPLLIAAASIVALLIVADPSDRELIAAVPALVVLGTFSVSTLRRAADNAIDWFSLALFTLALLAVWVYFAAWNAGIPPKMAASVARLVPGLDASVPGVATAVAMAATAGWIVLALWRVRRRPKMLWRGPFFAAGGLAAVWVVVVSIYGAPIEYSRSYASTAAVLAAQVRRVGGDGCVQGHHLPVGIRAMLAYHGGVNFGPQLAAPVPCRVAIQRDSQRTASDDEPLHGWKIAYEFTRRARYDEVFRVWVRDR